MLQWAHRTRRGCCRDCRTALLRQALAAAGAGTHPGSSSHFPLQMFCTGVGLDFNSDLVEKILKCRGANYMSVHTPGELPACVLSVFSVPQHGTCSARPSAPGCAMCWPGSPMKKNPPLTWACRRGSAVATGSPCHPPGHAIAMQQT